MRDGIRNPPLRKGVFYVITAVGPFARRVIAAQARLIAYYQTIAY